MKRIGTRALAALFAAALLAGLLPLRAQAAAPRTFTLSLARNLAVANSADITKKRNEIILKKLKKEEAVKGIKAKVKNLRSFRWSPLLSFKFPQKLNMIEEYELQIKPLLLDAEIQVLKHEMNDLRYAMTATVGKLYVDCYILQEKIAFGEETLAAAQTELAINQARLLIGEAKQDDIDKMTKSIETKTSELAEQKRSFETAKKDLTDLVKLDVTVGRKFTNPLKTADIPRADLEALVQYTLQNDQTVYTARTNKSTALLTLDAYEGLMKGQYGSKVDQYVGTFLNATRSGQDVDSAAFQLRYKDMLTALDKPWDKKIRILFFTFTKEWFKGEISGTRYIEDEMYALMTACSEYTSAAKELAAAEKSTRKQVESYYETLISARNAYRGLAATVENTRADLDRMTALNKIGKATYEELKDKQTEYQELQVEALDSLADYNDLITEYDRLTCGAVTKYLKGEGMDTDSGDTGLSFVDKPYYYIYTDVADLVFGFGVSIPEDFEPAVDQFEIWYEGTQLGARTEVGKEIRHLAIDYAETTTLTVRLFAGDEYIDECEIDTAVPMDILEIERAAAAGETAEEKLGTFQLSTQAMGDMKTSTLSLSVDAAVAAKYFAVQYGEGTNLYRSEALGTGESLTYLGILAQSLGDVKLLLYDKDGTLLRTARLDADTQEILAPVQTETEAAE